MGEDRPTKGHIRKLWMMELALYRDHLLRLDPESRRMRFGMTVDDRFIADYAARVNDLKSLIYAYVEDGDGRRRDRRHGRHPS